MPILIMSELCNAATRDQPAQLNICMPTTKAQTHAFHALFEDLFIGKLIANGPTRVVTAKLGGSIVHASHQLLHHCITNRFLSMRSI